MFKNRWLQMTIALIVTAFFLWLSFRDVKLEDLKNAFVQTNWLYAVPVLAMVMLSFWWRAHRWKVILDASAPPIPVGRLFGPMMIGFGFNNVFPARVGEIARPVALSRVEKVPLGVAFSSLILERVADVLTLLALLILMPFYITLDPNISMDLALGSTTYTLNARWFESKLFVLSIVSLVGLAGIGTMLIPPIRDLYLQAILWVPGVPLWLKEKFAAFVRAFTDGFSALRSPKAVILIAFYSIAIWMLVAFSFTVMSWGFPGGPDGATLNLTLGQSTAFLVVTCLIISLPSSPGFWGVFEFGGKLALLMMSATPNTPQGIAQALAFTMVVHFLNWAPTTIIGLYYAAKLSIKPADAAPAEPPSPLDARPEST